MSANSSPIRVDYRSLIHERIHRAYGFGARYVEKFNYDDFFAATDTLHDVGEILWFGSFSEWPEAELAGRIWLFGIMQALVVEQDATKLLLDCFGQKFDPEVEGKLNEVRELRVRSVGHPARHVHKNMPKKGCSFHSHRESGSRTRFKIITLVDFNRSEPHTIDVPELIAKQRELLDMALADVWGTIKDDRTFDPPV